MKIRKKPEIHERFRKEFEKKDLSKFVEKLDKLIQENIVLDEEDEKDKKK